MESFSCTTYIEQFNAEILNEKEKQEGCLQVTGDGEILRAEVQHISPKGRHTMVISSNPPMQQKAFQPWGKDNWPTQQESVCLVNWRAYNVGNIPAGPICRTIHKTAESARKCMAHIPGPNFVGYKPELMATKWHPTEQPPQAKKRPRIRAEEKVLLLPKGPLSGGPTTQPMLFGIRGPLPHPSLP